MTRVKFTAAAIVLAASAMLAFVLGQRRDDPGSRYPRKHAANPPAINAVRVSPPGDPSAEIECASLDHVEFTYRILNRSVSAVTGLKLGTKCSCEQVGESPDKLLPGESATIRFRLRAPRAGTLRRKIPFLADGTSEPLAELDVALRVKFDPPALLPLPGNVTVTCIEGDSAAHELVFEAIEAARDRPWISALKLDLSEGIEIHAPEVEELPEADPELTRRRYRFPLTNRSLPIGRHKAAATFQTRDGLPQIQDSPSVWIDVVDSVAIVPNPLVFRYAPGSPPATRQVRVIDRLGKRPAAAPAEYDHGLLRVEALATQGGSIAAFDVAPVEAAREARETQVVFTLGDGKNRTLIVRFDPSEQR
ncbi:MAG TPA: hypothetical protein VMV10_15725 [Pirellulales bacterium]|nr:hypothetical protein [Pirellulales bacterium]